MREWFIVSMLLIVTMAFYFALLTEIENVQTDVQIIQTQIENVQTDVQIIQTQIENVQTDVQIIQTQIDSTICMSLEQADNKTDMEENN